MRGTANGARRRRRAIGLVVLAAVVLAVLVAGPWRPTLGPLGTGGSPSESGPRATGEPGSALAALEELVVAEHAGGASYERDLFEYRAYDHDRNGCDIRNDVLRRDLENVVIREGTNGCVVETGTLTDPYTGETVGFERGADTSADVQIDHVVSLANAWRTGAQGWDRQTLREFGNDPLNLLAVDGPTNQAKSDADAAGWLPLDAAFHCPFAARQVAVKEAYALTVTVLEERSLRDVLVTCPSEPLPTATGTATPFDHQ